MPSCEEEHYESCLETLGHSPIASVFPLLRQGLYHVTSQTGLQGIQHDGFIRSNDGRFESTYEQSDRSYGRYRGFISLFDFETPSERECIKSIYEWESFFFRHQPTIVIGLNRCELDQELIANDTEWERFRGKNLKYRMFPVDVSNGCKST